MADVIYEPTIQTDNSSGMGFVLGMILLVVLAVLAFYYFGANRFLGGYKTPQVNVPGKIDVNINK